LGLTHTSRHTLSTQGTGSLRIGAAFIARYLPGRVVYLSDPTWGNHKNIFTDEKVEWRTYRYYDPATVGLDFAGMIADLEAAADGSIVVLHGCAHNPTGIDPTPAQWAKVADVCLAKKLIPFFDVAYQGFATGDLDADAAAPRLFASRGLEMFVAQSYSKNLGLYSERVGALNVVLASSAQAPAVLSQLKRAARPNYSNPPAQGAKIVSTIVGDAAMFARWKQELKGMAGRIAGVRTKLRAALEARAPGRDWGFVTAQIGMFSFTGLAPAQVENMTNKWHIYMTKDGRISLAGLSSAKVEYVADALVDSFKVPPK
jgi:aspartate aminotransferase